MEPKESSIPKSTNASNSSEIKENNAILSTYPEEIINLHELANQNKFNKQRNTFYNIRNMTYYKKYNYECSNNTKAFRDRARKD